MNNARAEMIQQQSNQLFQAHQVYLNELTNLDKYGFTPAQLKYHQNSLMRHHKQLWYSITQNHSNQRVNFVIKEESAFRQKLEDIRENDTTWNSTTDNLTNLQLHNFTSLHSYPYNPRYGT